FVRKQADRQPNACQPNGRERHEIPDGASSYGAGCESVVERVGHGKKPWPVRGKENNQVITKRRAAYLAMGTPDHLVKNILANEGNAEFRVHVIMPGKGDENCHGQRA